MVVNWLTISGSHLNGKLSSDLLREEGVESNRSIYEMPLLTLIIIRLLPVRYTHTVVWYWRKSHVLNLTDETFKKNVSRREGIVERKVKFFSRLKFSFHRKWKKKCKRKILYGSMYFTIVPYINFSANAVTLVF